MYRLMGHAERAEIIIVVGVFFIKYADLKNSSNQTKRTSEIQKHDPNLPLKI